MPPFRLGAAIAVLLHAAAMPAAAQEWNDPRTMALVTEATARRARQLADTGLSDYTATALGSLTFLAQVGEGFPDPPRVVKADQIALEVYWRAPSYSKQLILGRRDTLLLPTDIRYHRDHLGIVQNNFPGIIRLGEGDEVRDVPHPLSAAGTAVYDYAIHDSLRITIPGRVIDVLEVRFRPKDDRRPAAVGSAFLSRGDAQVVRMAFAFTRAALIDPQLEDVAIVLDNALIEERFWLPRRQEIEIRRSGTWLDFPARGIIRGGWEICCYRLNQGHPSTMFIGPEIQLAPPERRATFEFEGDARRIIPPDLATVSDADVARVQADAMALVGRRALQPARQGALLAPSVSDLVRVTRVEGMSLGIGLRRRLAPGLVTALRGRYGVSEHAVRGALDLQWQTTPSLALTMRAYRELADASLVPEASGIRNSVAAQEFAADDTEPFERRGVEVRLAYRGGAARAATLSLALARERTDSATVHGAPARGTFRPTLPVPTECGWRADLSLAVPPRPLWSGAFDATLGLRTRLRTGADDQLTARVSATWSWSRTIGDARLVFAGLGGATSSGLPQDLLFAGGPVTAPGYGVHQFAATALAAHRIEWQAPIRFPSIPLARWGRTPAQARVAPFVNLVAARRRHADGTSSWVGYPSAGVGLLAFFDLLRLDVARGVRGGRWVFGVDVTRDLWRIL